MDCERFIATMTISKSEAIAFFEREDGSLVSEPKDVRRFVVVR